MASFQIRYLIFFMISIPIENDAVAAGDGALITDKTLPLISITKSSIKFPFKSQAWALIPQLEFFNSFKV